MKWKDFCDTLKIGQELWVFDTNKRLVSHTRVKSIQEYPEKDNKFQLGDTSILVLSEDNEMKSAVYTGFEFFHGCDYDCVENVKSSFHTPGNIYKVYWEYIETSEDPMFHCKQCSYVIFDKDTASVFAHKGLDINWDLYLDDLKHVQEEF